MKNWIKSLFKRNKAKETIPKETTISKKYLVKKIIHEEIVYEDKLKEIIEEYHILKNNNTKYAYKDGVKVASFNPEPPYKLEITQIDNYLE